MSRYIKKIINKTKFYWDYSQRPQLQFASKLPGDDQEKRGLGLRRCTLFAADSQNTFSPLFCSLRNVDVLSRSYCRKCPTHWLRIAGALLCHQGTLRRDCLGAIAGSACSELCHCCYLVLHC